MPVLIITPDISAETCDGAAGCASGSQTCIGKSPAFMPKPARKTANSGSAGCVRKYSASAPNAAEPVTASRRTNPTTSSTKPMCIMIR